MKNIIILVACSLITTACGQKYVASEFVGGSYRYVYHNNVALSNKSLSVLKETEEFKDDDTLNAVTTFNARYEVFAPTEKVGKDIADTMEKRFKFKHIAPDRKIGYGEYLVGEMQKEDKADYWLVVDTPVWLLKKSIFSGMTRMTYAIQYRLFDTKTQKILLGNSCISESEGVTLEEFSKDKFAYMKTELAKIPAHCHQEIVETIDPNKTGRFMSRTIY